MIEKISVILPCYNEERIIEEIIRKVNSFSKNNKSYEFLFVNDGSTDNTSKIIENTINSLKNNSLMFVSYEDNQGKGHAIKKGVSLANGIKICFLDSDLAYSLEHLFVLSEELNRNDMVIGSRSLLPDYNSRRIKKARIFIGKTYNLLLRIILGIPYLDTQAGIKGFKKRAAKELFSNQRINKFSFDVELLYLARKKGMKVKEIPVKVSEEHKNQISQVKIIRDSINMFLGLFEIRLNDIRGKYG